MADVETLLLSKIISSLDIETTIAAGIEIDWFEDFGLSEDL